jgi:hypothetical protein
MDTLNLLVGNLFDVEPVILVAASMVGALAIVAFGAVVDVGSQGGRTDQEDE